VEPIRYQPVREDNVILVKGRGHLSTADILNYTHRVEEDELCVPGMNEFIDLTEVEVYDVDAQGMRRVVVEDQSVSKTVGINKCALFSDSDYIFGMSRMYQMLSAEDGIEIQAFRSRDDAAAWLGLSEATLKLAAEL